MLDSDALCSSREFQSARCSPPQSGKLAPFSMGIDLEFNIISHLLYSLYLSMGPSISLSLNGMCLGALLSAPLALSVPKGS
jgi:hypothetical protein